MLSLCVFYVRAIRPYILVQTNPQSIDIGQPLAISARLYDRDTNQPLIVRKIYLNIISMKDGHTIWPLEVVRKNDWKFDIMIGTDNMKRGHHYLVRVSNNRNLSPMGATEFDVVKDNQVPIAIFLIPLVIRKPEDDLDERDIEKLIFRTQMDHRVCPLCKPYENQIFSPDEAIPKIPVHPNCRCTYDVIFKDIFEASFNEIQQIYQTATAVRTLKVINVVNQIP